jgi:hypothetical protein
MDDTENNDIITRTADVEGHATNYYRKIKNIVEIIFFGTSL